MSLVGVIVSVLAFTEASSPGAATVATGVGTSELIFGRACGTGCGDVYAVDQYGVERRLTTGAQAIEPVLSADRASIVFARDRASSGSYAFYRLRLASGETSRLTTPRDASDTAPAVRRDGAIAFARTFGRNRGVALVLLKHGRQRVLARESAIADPAWSPDGRHLAHTTLSRGTPQIVVLELGSREVKQVASWGGGSQVAWAPDGRTIAFVGGSEPGIHVRRLSTRSRIVAAGVGARAPEFSPDGRWLVFSDEVARTRAGTALFVVPRAGGLASS